MKGGREEGEEKENCAINQDNGMAMKGEGIQQFLFVFLLPLKNNRES
jgi:hypothetical protein